MDAKVKGNPNCRKVFLVLALGSFFLIWLCGHDLIWAAEKAYPSQPIKIVVPNSPGGHADLVSRFVADHLAKELRVPVLIENRAGSSGMHGVAMVLKAKPDGYTILGGGDTTMCTGYLQNPNPPYNPFTDFLFICGLGVSPSAYGVYGSSPFRTLMDFVKAAKENPGKLSCGVTTIGSSTHLSLILLRKYAEMDIKVVPYKGNPDAIPALLGKHIDMLTLTTAAFLPYAESGEARILAVSNSIPGTSFKTLREEGFSQSGFDAVDGFLCYTVSVNTPKPIFDKLVLMFEQITRNPAFNAKLNSIGSICIYRNPADFKAFLKEKWRVNSKLLEELGLKRYDGKID